MALTLEALKNVTRTALIRAHRPMTHPLVAMGVIVALSPFGWLWWPTAMVTVIACLTLHNLHQAWLSRRRVLFLMSGQLPVMTSEAASTTLGVWRRYGFLQGLLCLDTASLAVGAGLPPTLAWVLSTPGSENAAPLHVLLNVLAFLNLWLCHYWRNKHPLNAFLPRLDAVLQVHALREEWKRLAEAEAAEGAHPAERVESERD